MNSPIAIALNIEYFFGRKIPVAAITFYQYFLSFDRGLLSLLAPGGACKYTITCSEYTKQAILEKGLFKGMLLGGKRVISCR